MRITFHGDDGTEADVTEAVQIIYDALTASMDYGSGFLDWEEIQAITMLATLGGWEQPVYDHEFCAACHHDLEHHRRARYNAAGAEFLPMRCVQRMVGEDGRYDGTLCGCENGGDDIRPKYARDRDPDHPVPQHAPKDNGA